jgi:uncharacterized protein YidB (DUF937 family)
MAVFDTLIDDVANQFGLGSDSGRLTKEILSMISSTPGGLGGFLDNLKAAGLSSEVASWVGHPNGAPLAAARVDRALGSATVSGIASRLGLAPTVVSTAVGYALPRVIGLLTPGGVIPTSLPAEVTSFVAAAPLTRAAEAPVSWVADAQPESNRLYSDKNEFVKFSPSQRFELWGQERPLSLVIAILGIFAAIFTSLSSISNLLETINKYFGIHIHFGYEFMLPAYADTGSDHSPVYSCEIKSAIISTCVLALFIAFIWSLYTVSKSTNAKAVDIASEAIKTLSGFFIGALTGFLG